MPHTGDQRTWSTAGHRPELQLAVWRQIVADAFVPVTVSPQDPYEEGFASEVGGRRIGDVHLMGLNSQRQVVERTPSHIAAHPGDLYFLNAPVHGSGSAQQFGRVASAGSDSFVVVDSDQPFRLEFGATFSQFTLVIPKPLLDPLLVVPGVGVGVGIKADAGAGALVTALLRGLAEHSDELTPRQARAATDHLLGLVAMALAGAAAPVLDARALLLQQAIDEAERSLGDPDLTAHTLAARLCISTSYLTKLFAARGLSFGRWLLGRRLDRAWAELAPGASDGRTITDVAFACGFRDSAHFARTFRARFGTTPSGRRTMGA